MEGVESRLPAAGQRRRRGAADRPRAVHAAAEPEPEAEAEADKPKPTQRRRHPARSRPPSARPGPERGADGARRRRRRTRAPATRGPHCTPTRGSGAEPGRPDGRPAGSDGRAHPHRPVRALDERGRSAVPSGATRGRTAGGRRCGCCSRSFAVVFALALVQNDPCLKTNWADDQARYGKMCYSDVPYLYTGRGFAESRWPYADAEGRYEVMEYPVGISYLAWVAPRSPSSTLPDRRSRSGTTPDPRRGCGPCPA